MKAQANLLIISIVLVAIIVIGTIFFAAGINSEKNTGSSSEMIVEGENNAEDMIVEETEDKAMPESPKTYTVDIEDFSYKTKTLSIKKGDTVVWTNKDSAGHTVTSDSGNELDSSPLNRGASYSHTFTETGTFDYHCKPHPYMKGTIIVG